MTWREAIERWERWWFPPSTGFNLAVCRILVVGAQLFVFMPFFMASPSEHIALIERGVGFDHPQWLVRAVATVLPPAVVPWAGVVRWIYAITIASGLTTLVGLRTRLSAFVFALGTWFLVSHETSYGETYHTEILISFFLLFLALSPSGRHLSIDALRRKARIDPTTDRAVWPLRLIQVLFAWTFFSNAIAKLVYGGLAWMNGYTLQQYLLTRYLQWDRPLALWIAQRYWLSVGLSIATLVLELSFPLALFVRRARPFLLTSAVVFFLIIYMAMKVVFFQHIVLFAVFVDFESLASRIRSVRTVPALEGA